MTGPTVDVLDGGRLLQFGLADLMRPTGSPVRREIRLETAFPGPGARDAFELVTRAVTEDRYAVRPEMERPELGRVRARYVFRWSYRDRTVTLQIREGFVTEEFITLARTANRSAAQEAHLAVLKQEMADRLLAVAPDQVYDITECEAD
jgi:hypothetical protein